MRSIHVARTLAFSRQRGGGYLISEFCLKLLATPPALFTAAWPPRRKADLVGAASAGIHLADVLREL